MFDVKEFGKSIKTHRKKLKISAYNFAIAANIDFTYLSNIERGTNIPTIKTVVSILNAFNMSFSECINNTTINQKDRYKNIINCSLNTFDEKDLLYLLKIAETFHQGIEE